MTQEVFKGQEYKLARFKSTDWFKNQK